MENIRRSGILTDEDIREKYHEQRKVNMKLLEERRELLLQLQTANRYQTENENLSEECKQLKKKVTELEEKLADSTNKEQHVGAIVGQKEASEISRPSLCGCDSAEKLKEAISVNHEWNDAFQRSVKRYNELEKLSKRMDEQLKTEIEDNAALRDLVEKLENDLKNCSKPDFKRLKSSETVCSKDDIEALKLQVITYLEDFKSEKEEKEKVIRQNENLKTKIDEATKTIQSLSDQVIQYRYLNSRMSEVQAPMERLTRRNNTDFYTYPRYHRQLSPSYSYPGNEDILARAPTSAASNQILRRSDSDLFKGGDVVRDS